MKSIYQAADLVDAQRVVDLLAFEGIPAHVQGGYLAGAIGELPAGGIVSVWVGDDEVERARALIAEDAAAPREPLPDDDFDGRFESTMQYADAQIAFVESDLDGDGEAEWRHEFEHDVIRVSLLRDAATGAVVKRITHAGGQRLLEEFDADGDGTLETARHYDARDERVP